MKVRQCRSILSWPSSATVQQNQPQREPKNQRSQNRQRRSRALLRWQDQRQKPRRQNLNPRQVKRKLDLLHWFDGLRRNTTSIFRHLLEKAPASTAVLPKPISSVTSNIQVKQRRRPLGSQKSRHEAPRRHHNRRLPRQ